MRRFVVRAIHGGARTRCLLWAALIVLIFATGCPGPPGPGPPPYDVTDLVFSANTQQTIVPAQVPDPADIARVEVVVIGRDSEGVWRNPLATQALGLEDTAWRGLIPGLPIGPELTFVVTAYGALPEEPELFQGFAQKALAGPGESITVPLNPIPEGGGSFTLPIIESITRPAEVECESESEVTVSIRARRRERLEVSVTSGGGSFDPAEGTLIADRRGRATAITTYTAGSEGGASVHTLRVEDSDGTVVETDFSIVVVYTTTDAEATTSFAPSVTELSASTEGDTVTWEATAADDGPEEDLSYHWSFAQHGGTDGAHFADPAANPAALTGHDQTVFGTVTLTVTDGDGLSTTISFDLVAGQFAHEDEADAEG